MSSDNGQQTTSLGSTATPTAPLPSSRSVSRSCSPSLGWLKARRPVIGAIWLVLAVAAASLLPKDIEQLTGLPRAIHSCQWFLCMVGLIGLLVMLGLAKSGRPAGVLITQRNLVSLSRLQLIVWMTLVLSFFAAAVFRRLIEGVPDPLNIAVSAELWGLLGISTASLVGTPFLLSVRQGKGPADPAKAAQSGLKTLPAVSPGGSGQTPPETAEQILDNAQGPLYANASPEDARFSDIFEGDEVSNTYTIDLAKVQMFFFTVVTALVWTRAAVSLMHSPALLHADAALPSLPAGMVTLLGVSHAGYLLNKLVDHTPTN